MLVRRYLEGKMDPDEVESFENSVGLMKEAIRRSHNKTLFESCSIELKTNLDFIKFLFKTFNDDDDFLFKIAYTYVSLRGEYVGNLVDDNKEAKKDFISLVFYMSNLEKVNMGNCGSVFTTLLFSQYMGFIDEMHNHFGEYGKDFHNGFKYIKDYFDGNDELIVFFADILFWNLIMSKADGLDSFVEQHFSSYDEVYWNLIPFLYGYLKKFDEDLAEFVVSDEEFISNIYNKIMSTDIEFQSDKNTKPKKVVSLASYRK